MEGCGAHVAEKRNTYRVFAGNLKELDHLEDLEVEGRIFKRMLKIRLEVEWTNLVQDKDQHLAVMNTGMNTCFPQNAEMS
jgi:hypothetical protein